MMRRLGAMLWATGLVIACASAPVQAAEKGLIIRAGDLMAEPFIDAAKTGPVAASAPVTLLERRGGWVRIETGGSAGWVRMLNVRLEAGAATLAAAPATGRSNPLSLLRTGSSGRTVTTGIKGLGEEDIRNASANYAQLDQLGKLAVGAAETRANAQQNQLKESNVAYLKTPKKERRK
jgi:hypothetical protein